MHRAPLTNDLVVGLTAGPAVGAFRSHDLLAVPAGPDRLSPGRGPHAVADRIVLRGRSDGVFRAMYAGREVA
jgi:hypothetical protein